MRQIPLIKCTQWDAVALGMPTWELLEYSAAAMRQVETASGHYTVKTDPLVDKRLLHEFGFYYCDTLIEPHCDMARLRAILHFDATISKEFDCKKALEICHSAFSHGRFHRDFNLPKISADIRYENWLMQLIEAKQVYGLYWQGALAGFIGHIDNNLVLHALAEQYRGKGLSKYWWSAVCNELLAATHEEVKSSVSASNVAVLNLYTSLGFLLKNPKDIYHRLVL